MLWFSTDLTTLSQSQRDMLQCDLSIIKTAFENEPEREEINELGYESIDAGLARFATVMATRLVPTDSAMSKVQIERDARQNMGELVQRGTYSVEIFNKHGYTCTLVLFDGPWD